MTAAGRVAALCRHPVKSVGYETLDEVVLEAGRSFPFDREWAVAHAGARFGAEGPGGWAAKLNFLRGWGSASLMAVACRSDRATRTLLLTHPDRPPLTLRPDAEPQALVDWLRPLWPAVRPEPAQVVCVPGQAMTDVPDPWVALLSLSSLDALSAQAGQALSIHRWRGNIWVRGWAPWAEFGLIGQEIAIGGARLRVEARITRCRATAANPATGLADIDTLALLDRGYGHQDFGVYARVLQGGRVALGDPVG
jgi:hypothetical protein